MTSRAGKRRLHGRLSPEDLFVATEYLKDLYDMVNGTGRHMDHEQKSVIGCVFCSCGVRAVVHRVTQQHAEPGQQP